jgi:hypothetical protein
MCRLGGEKAGGELLLAGVECVDSGVHPSTADGRMQPSEEQHSAERVVSAEKKQAGNWILPALCSPALINILPL